MRQDKTAGHGETLSAEELRDLVRTVPDFPKPGILFRDVTTLMGDGAGFSACVDLLAERARSHGAEVIAGVEARGFVFGAAMAAKLGIGFVPVRKPGKLPVPALSLDYALEYGTDTLEIDPGALKQGQRVVLVDDLLATGGTALAAAQLVRLAGGQCDTALFVIDLPDIGGGEKLREAGLSVEALMEFPGH